MRLRIIKILVKIKAMEENIVEPKQKSRKKLVTVIIFIIILIAIGYLVGTEINRWWKVRKEYIRMGFASDKFPFRMYTEKELVEMGRWPVESDYYNSIPTRTTPEETYAIFKQALIDGDLDKAVECFVEQKREEYREALIKAKEEGRIPEILKQLTEIYPRGERIVNGRNDTSIATYEFFIIENDKKISHPLGFVKDENGDWKLENL